MDPLSDALRVLRITGAMFVDAEFTAPWCVLTQSGLQGALRLEPWENVIFFHLLTEGRCQVRLASDRSVIDLESGDVVMMARDAPHLLGSDLRLPPQRSEALIGPASASGLMRIEHGGGGERTRFGCGFIVCDERLARPLLGALPGILRIRLGEGPGVAWLRSLMAAGTAESAGTRPGSETVRASLSELLFVEVLRRHVETLPPGHTGWFAGLRDRHVGRALALLHARPGHAWSVDALAEQVGLSRSALAQRFTDLVGRPPMLYLTRWRLTVAAQRLRTGAGSIGQIAADVGYESEAAFNRAFKRELGMPPAAWRRDDGRSPDARSA